jgi:subtilisin family serine protease
MKGTPREGTVTMSLTVAPMARTYRRGRPVQLGKRVDAFVVRSLPSDGAGITLPDGCGLEPVSPASTRVVLPASERRSDELEVLRDELMDQTRATGLVTHHAYDSSRSGAEFLLTDRVFVTFRRPVTQDVLTEFEQRYHVRWLDAIEPPFTYLYELTDLTGAGVVTKGSTRGVNPLKLVVHLTEHDDSVRLADHDLNQRMRGHVIGEPTFRRQWHLHTRTTDPRFRPTASTRCERAWRQLGGRGDPDVVVAITDDGCNLEQLRFSTPEKVAGWARLRGHELMSDEDQAVMWQASTGHGTMCAALAVGEGDGVGVVGAAPGCRLLPVRWEVVDGAIAVSDSKLIAVLDHVSQRADVMSSSWGLAPTHEYAEVVLARIRALGRVGGRRGKGIVFVWSAGNENCPINYEGEAFPCSDGWRTAGGERRWERPATASYFHNDLAELDEVLIVGAVASDARRTHYSNFGPGLDLCAPAENFHTYSRMDLPSLDLAPATEGVDRPEVNRGGTSHAAPIVAGIAALVISADPRIRAADVIRILKQTAWSDLRIEPYPRTPPTDEDPDTSWDQSPSLPGAFRPSGRPEGTWSAWYGYGRIDAAAAVRAAQSASRLFTSSKPRARQLLTVPRTTGPRTVSTRFRGRRSRPGGSGRDDAPRSSSERREST